MTAERAAAPHDERALALEIAERWKDTSPYAFAPDNTLGILSRALLAAQRSERATPDMAEIKSQCEAGLIATHDCPAVFALAAIYAEITDAEREAERQERGGKA